MRFRIVGIVLSGLEMQIEPNASPSLYPTGPFEVRYRMSFWPWIAWKSNSTKFFSFIAIAGVPVSSRPGSISEKR
ncbi:MAG: hypothetical protein ACK5OC_22445, partial [Pirellula sp.]